MECRHSKTAEAAAAPRSSPFPLLQRSRSGSSAVSSRLCSSSSPAPSFYPNQQAGAARPKSQYSSSSSSSATKPSKESPRAGGKKPMNVGLVPSAWALSPGRSLVGPAEGAIGGGGGGERKRNGGMMGFLMMRRKKGGASEKEEAVHQLRLMTSRLLQWRFVNARARRATARLRSSVERRLFLAWLRINELNNIVAAKWILIQRRRHKMKLARILNPQVHLLKKWEPLAKKNLDAVSALSRVLQGLCVPLPLVDGAQVDLTLLHDYISMSMDMMIEIEAAIRIFYSKAEELSLLISELAGTVVLEMEGLKQLTSTNTTITSLETYETSLRANLIQTVKKKKKDEVLELPQMSSLSLQMTTMAAAWRQYHPWNILV